MDSLDASWMGCVMTVGVLLAIAVSEARQRRREKRGRGGRTSATPAMAKELANDEQG